MNSPDPEPTSASESESRSEVRPETDGGVEVPSGPGADAWMTASTTPQSEPGSDSRAAIVAHLQLVRLPNVLTAAGDSLAGWLIVQGTFDGALSWVPLVVASMLIYAAGVTLNDLFDLETDRGERPERPLPSGRVPSRNAVAIVAVGLCLGLALAGLVGTESLIVAGSLVGCVLAYDLGGKRTPLRPVLMGGCRAANLLLGMSLAPALGGPEAWILAFCYGLFVAGITLISTSETGSQRSWGLTLGIVLENLAVLGLAVIASQGLADRLPQTPSLPPPQFVSPSFAERLLGLVGLAVLIWANNNVTLTAWRTPSPSTIQRAVIFGILSLVGLHMATITLVRGPLPALSLLVLALPASLLSRRLKPT